MNLSWVQTSVVIWGSFRSLTMSYGELAFSKDFSGKFSCRGSGLILPGLESCIFIDPFELLLLLVENADT